MTGCNSKVRLATWLFLVWMVIGATAAKAAVELTEGVIDRWLKSQPELQAWAVKNQSRLEPHESKDEWSDLASVENMLYSLNASGLYNEAAGIMNKYGFAKPEEWAEVTIRVIKAYLANELEGRDAEIETLKAEIAALELDSQVPENQKAAMLQAMRGNLAMIDMVRTSPDADRSAVKPHMAVIRSHVGAQQPPQ